MSSEPLIEPVRPKWRRRTITIVGALVAVALVVTGVRMELDRRDRDQRDKIEKESWCDGSGEVRRVGDTQECVGVSDGSYEFTSGNGAEDAALRKVQQLIAKANEKIVDQPYYTVVYLLPMSWNKQGDVLPGSAVRQLYGAYVAQVQANSANDQKVRILIANTGHGGIAWEEVATRLVERRSADRIWIVAGLGPSRPTTSELVGRLSENLLPMVGATITADNLNGDEFEHLYRVAPTNSEQVAVALDYLRHLRSLRKEPGPTDDPEVNRTFLVQARRPDNKQKKEDPWVKALEEAFRAEFGSNFVTKPFDPDAPGRTSAIADIAATICKQRSAVTVYFAGRSDPLRDLLIELRNCDQKLPVTVLTGDDASNLLLTPNADLDAALEHGNVRVYYTGLAHPDQWKDAGSGKGTSRTTLATLLDHRSDDGFAAGLKDGVGIMAFDAVTVAVEVVRRLGVSVEDKPHPLINGFTMLNEERPVCGASGPLGLTVGPVLSPGLAVNKPIPIIRLAKNASFEELRYPPEPPPEDRKPLEYTPGPTGWAGKCGL